MGFEVESESDHFPFNRLLSAIVHEISNYSQSILLIGQLLQEFWTDVQGVLARQLRDSGDFLAGGTPYSQLHLEMPEYLSAVVDNAGKIDALIHELTSLFRSPEAPHSRPVDLSSLARSVHLLTAYELKKAGLALDLQSGERLPLVMVRPQDLVIGLVTLIHRICQIGRYPQGKLGLSALLDEKEQAVVCDLRVPLEARYDEELGAEPTRNLLARCGGNLEIRREGEALHFTLAFPLQPPEGGDGEL